MDIAFDPRVHLRTAANSVESIFQNVEKTPIKARLFFPVKACRLTSL